MGTIEKADVRTWSDRCMAWNLLAASFRYPTRFLADSYDDGSWHEAMCEVCRVLKIDEACKLSEEAGFCGNAARSLVSDSLESLRIEATRLFVGAPEPVVSPYEGIWRSGDDCAKAVLFASPAASGVSSFYRACGLRRSSDRNESPDHIATECEFLAWLSSEAAQRTSEKSEKSALAIPGGSACAAYGSFLSVHLGAWGAGFAKQVVEESRHPLYGDAGRFLGAFLAREMRGDYSAGGFPRNREAEGFAPVTGA